LGLATVYGIVKQNEGFIDVESRPGRGTAFRIFLPLVNADQGDIACQPMDQALASGSGTVLIVEDDAAILELAKSILMQLGYAVLAASTPDQAMELARNQEGGIDLLITDVVMPQMNGKQLAQRIAEFSDGFKCLYMSGYTADIIANRGVLDEGVHFLQKPFSIKELATKVREVLER